MRIRWVGAALAAVVLLVPGSSAQTDTGVLRFEAPVFKTKTTKTGLKFSPLKVAKGTFEVAVALLDAPGGTELHVETLTYTVRSSETSAPEAGQLSIASTVNGSVDVVLGADAANPLPSDLLGDEVWFTTRAVTFKKNGEAVEYEPAPPQPLGLSGATRGQDIAPRAVDATAGITTTALTLSTDATVGFVLTADADGNATWQAAQISVDAIGTDQIIDETITAADIGAGAVGASEIAAGAVDTTHVADGGITGADVADDTLTADDIGPGAISASELASGAVDSDSIADGAITGADVAIDTLTANAIAANAIGPSELADGAVDSASIIDGTIVSADLAPGALGSEAIGAGAITSFQLAEGAVASVHIADSSIGADDIGNGLLTGGDISINSGQVVMRESMNVFGTSASFYEFLLDGFATSANDNAVEIRAPSTAHEIFQLLEIQVGLANAFRFDASGDAYAAGVWNANGADYADLIEVSTGAASVEPGDLLVIDPHEPRAVVKSSEARSRLVAGIYSTQPSVLGWGGRETELAHPDEEALLAAGEDVERTALTARDAALLWDDVPLALVGIAPCKVSAENGSIRPGDLLVTSWTPGHAMRDDVPEPGTIVGKALGTLASGTGVIEVLVTLQ